MGKVYLVEIKSLNRVYALKEVRLDAGRADEREIPIMQSIRHERIVCFHDYRRFHDHVAILLEYVPYGDLSGFLNTYGGKLNQHQAKALAAQMLDAIDYLHTRRVIHRDIKPANILVACEDPPKFKLTDFGLARLIERSPGPDQLTFCGTLLYCAPEVYRSTYNYGADIWSFGVTLWASICGSPPFKPNKTTFADAKRSMYRLVHQPKLSPAPLRQAGLNQNIVSLIVDMLQIDPKRRPSAKNCLVRLEKWYIEADSFRSQ